VIDRPQRIKQVGCKRGEDAKRECEFGKEERKMRKYGKRRICEETAKNEQ
jgi:hypothetical protein